MKKEEQRFFKKVDKFTSSIELCDYLHEQAFLRDWIRVRDQRRFINFSIEFFSAVNAQNILPVWARGMIEKGRGSCKTLIYCWELREKFSYTVDHIAAGNKALFLPEKSVIRYDPGNS